MKVFGIGLSKTGTSSLASALELLGYNVKDCLGVAQYSKGDISSINKDALLQYDALTDTPIPSFYQELDKEYPAAKFILTIRDMDSWLKSCKKQFNQKSADLQSEAQHALFFDLYGTTVFDEDKFKQGYLNFTNEVKAYFKDRPDDLLVLNVINGEGWEKLCPFLDKPTPIIPFPKSNVTRIRWLNIHELAQSTRNNALKLHELSTNLTVNSSTNLNKIKQMLCSFIGLDSHKRIGKYTAKAQQNITQKLLSLDANIPVITNTQNDTPLETRAAWNHFWLISCSEGSAQLENDAVGYTINLALIEDGLPYLGIIYIPETDTLYYAATDKGAFKVQGNNSPIRLESPLANNLTNDTNTQKISSTQSIGSLLCQAAENNAASHFAIESSKEWQTAAVQAILKTLGLTLIDDTSNAELKYNKQHWVNAPTSITMP
ncbi:MAG: hypothetical protein methR_P1880 [Methyloprofundus sp.]|nr:MAG: hypothetical protein methR_P1880 [Methyloprofundus sp.]